MKENYNLFFRRIIFAFLLMIASVATWGQTYTQITTISELTNGDYLIAGDGATNDGIMLNTVTTATPFINSTTVTNPGTTISTGYTTDNVFQITVSGGNITIYNSSIGYVSWGRTGNTGNTATFFNGTIANTEQWTPTVASGLWTLANVSTSTRLLQWNTSSPRFACYTTGQTKLKLYKLAGKTVTFNSNGGTGTMANQTASSATNLTANTFTRTGYSFANWNTAADASGTTYSNTGSYPFTADATLYAQWKGNVTYNANGGTGTVTDSNDYSPNAPVTTQANGFTYSGFTFAGWNTQADGLGTNYAASTASAFNFSGNITLYAKWSSAYSITFANLQFPGSKTINESETFEVYGQVYAAGLTETGGAGAGIIAEVGYSSSNTNPNTAGWTWISAPFSSQVGNNDEYKGTLGTGITPGTYYYATRYKIGSGGTWVYGGYNTNTPTAGGIWNGTSNVNGVLTVNSNTVSYANIQFPTTGSTIQGDAFSVYSRVYKSGYTDAAGANANISAWIGYSTTNATTGSDFATASWTWVPASYNTQVGNDDEYVANIGTSLAAGTYYYVSRYQVTGSTEYKYGGTNNNFWTAPANSGVLTVQTAQEINVKQGAANIATGGSYGFGNQTSGSTGSAVTFTVENLGQANLILSGTPKIALSGTNAAEFTVNETTTTSPVTSAGSTTFAVAFSPTSLGAKTAQLSIANNDTTGSENPYIINLTGTGIASTSSDIIVKTGYVYPQDIPYINYQATNITGGTNDIEIAQFTIRDGGATIDADNFGTTLTQLSFNLTGGTNIRRVAIYDGTTEIAEQAGSTTHTFSALNLTAPDGGTKDFSIRVSFKTAVTDNQQIGIGITATTTAATTGSTFANTSAGGAITSSASNNNRIEVTADRLAFTTQPTNTGINSTMSSVVVSASDINGNKDLDYSGNVSITSTGTLTGSPVTVAASSGTATFTSLIHTVLGTGLTLSATSTGLTGVISNTFDISSIAYVDGDYRSINDGNWHGTASSGSTNTWQQLTSGVWTAVSNSPPSSLATLGTNKVYINNSISLVGTNTAPNVIILQGGKLTSSVTATFGNLLIKSGGEFYRMNNATGMNSSGVFEIEDGGTAYITQTNTSIPSIWAGTEKFHPNSNVVIKRLDAGAVITDTSSFTPFTDANGNSAYFGNLIMDSSVDMNVLDGSSGVAATSTWITNGDLILRSGTTGTSAFRFVNGTGTTSTTALPYTIGGNFIIESGFLGSSTLRNSSVTTHIKVNKDFIMNGSSTFRMTGTIITTGVNFYVNGNIKLNDTSTFLFSSNVNNSSPILSLYLKGDIDVASGATFTNLTTAANNANLYFVGNGDGTSDALTQTIGIASQVSNAKINFSLIWPANPSVPYIKLTKDLYLGTNSIVNVRTNATLDFGFDGTTALNIGRVASSTGQSFTAATGSVLKITSPDGISNATSGYTGNVQVGTTAAARVFDPGATYHYVGIVNQITGNGLPSQITNKVIAELDTQNATQDDLELRSTGTTTFGTTGGVNGVLEIRKGKVIDEPGNGFRNYNGALDDGENDTQRGDLKMTGGRYVVSGSGTKPSLSGTYTLTAGTIEFAGIADTKIRTSTPAKQYFNVDISGTAVETGGKNFVVNNLLKVTASTAILTVPEIIDDAATPYVVTAKKGIQVTTGGKALFKNNANLIQDVDAVNIGNITMERKANVPSIQYNYWSSPVKNQALYNLYPGIPTDKVMVYNSANDKFTVLTTASNPQSAFAKGYSIRGSSNASFAPALTASFVGVPNNEMTAGTNTIPLSTFGSNYNLIGNPYPSNLNLTALYNDSDNSGKFYNGADETPTAYLWDNTSNTDLNQIGSTYATYSQNNYALLNLSSGVGTPAPRTGATKKPNGIVKPGQGFIIRSAETGGNLTFKNSFRTTAVKNGTVDGVYYKANEQNNDRYWLTLTTPNNMNIVIAVGYYPNSENYFERFDSTVFSESVSENFYSLSSDTKKLAIQGRKYFNQDDVIPLGVKTFNTGTQKISIESKEGTFEAQNIYLKDKLLNTITNLSQNSYTFTSAKGIDNTRFEIVYKENSTLGTDNIIKSDFEVYKDGQVFVIKSSDNLGKVELYNTAGVLVGSKSSSQREIRWDTNTLPSGVYIIKAENSGNIRTKKIIK